MSTRSLTIAISIGGLVTLASCSSKETDIVKNGTLPLCPEHSVQQMVNNFFNSPTWIEVESKVGDKLVIVWGNMHYHGKPVTGELQFVVDIEDKTFRFRAFGINQVPQTGLVADVLFRKMCAAASNARRVDSVEDAGNMELSTDFSPTAERLNSMVEADMLESATRNK